jgi:hypothetical protein
MSAPTPLRQDFDASQLRGLARKTKDGPQARRLLALAAIYDGATRTEAVRRSEPRIDSSCYFSTAQESDSRSNVSLATQFFQQPARDGAHQKRYKDRRKRTRPGSGSGV